MAHPASNACELLELYVLGGLSPEDAQTFEAHVVGCENCAARKTELTEVIGLIPLTVDPQPVPEGMKRRVLRHVLGEQQPPQPPEHSNLKRAVTRSRVLAAGLAAASMILIVYTAQLRMTVNDLEDQLNRNSSPIQELRVNQAVQLSPAAENIVSRGLATIVVDQRGTHLLVQAEQLPKLEGTEAYQVWLIKGDEKRSAGTFVTEHGYGAIYYDFEPDQYDTIAITLEPDAFGELPRGQVVLAAPLPS